MTDIQALNAIITQLGGTTAYLYNIQAYNAWSVLQGGVGTYTRDIDALNAIDVLNGGSGGHRYNINALNSIDVAAGGTGGHTRDISALTSLGTLLNPLPAWGLLPYFSIPNDIIVITAGVNRTLYGDALINVPIENDLSVTYSGYGTQSGNNLNLTPVVGDIGDHALTITFRQAGALIGTYIVTVKVIAAVPDAPYKLMIIGDSLVYLGHVNIATGIDNAISATISYIGGLGTTIKHEGVSGSSFATWAGASSRFYVSSELNIPAYLAANSLDTPDFFHVRLGVNDMFGHSDDDLTDVIMNAIIADAKILVDKCLSVNAGVKVIIGLPSICENTGAGWNTNYDESIYNQDKYIEIIHKFWAGLISYFEDYNDRVYISNEAIFLDRDEGYPKEGGIHINGVHPSTSGYQQLGIGIADTLNSVISQMNTLSKPTIFDVAVKNLKYFDFAVDANIDPHGLETTVLIEYGLTDSYGSTQAIVTGSPISVAGPISAAITGLTNNTLYHYRIKAINAAGTSYSDDATVTTANTVWTIPITGRSGVTAVAGNLVFDATEDITVEVTGSVTISVLRTADNGYRRHSVTVNCPNDTAGAVVVTGKDKIVTLGNYHSVLMPNVPFYYGTQTTSPILTFNASEAPLQLLKAMINWGAAQIFIANGTLPVEENCLLVQFDTIGGSLTIPKIPASLRGLGLIGNNIILNSNVSFGDNLSYLTLSGTNINWTGLSIGDDGNVTTLTLTNYRTAKMSSADMITLLTQLTTRTGTLPATITINDYADYASPPAGVTTAVNALKAAKSITTVNLGA